MYRWVGRGGVCKKGIDELAGGGEAKLHQYMIFVTFKETVVHETISLYRLKCKLSKNKSTYCKWSKQNKFQIDMTLKTISYSLR